MKQRDLMRELFHRFDGDRARAVEAYAKAKRGGMVKRVRNGHGMSPEEYASRLFADGIKKKWIRG
jgi:hypothetical protein